jgi:hypothetical protein
VTHGLLLCYNCRQLQKGSIDWLIQNFKDLLLTDFSKLSHFALAAFGLNFFFALEGEAEKTK